MNAPTLRRIASPTAHRSARIQPTACRNTCFSRRTAQVGGPACTSTPNRARRCRGACPRPRRPCRRAGKTTRLIKLNDKPGLERLGGHNIGAALVRFQNGRILEALEILAPVISASEIAHSAPVVGLDRRQQSEYSRPSAARSNAARAAPPANKSKKADEISKPQVTSGRQKAVLNGFGEWAWPQCGEGAASSSVGAC